MVDRWFYTLGGMTYGPVTAAQLNRLINEKQLPASEFVWPEGADVQIPVPAFAALQPSGRVPRWLEDVRRAEQQAAPPKRAGSLPGWLKDVQRAEQLAQPKRPTTPPKPAWLEDVRRAEECEPPKAIPVAAPVTPSAVPVARPALIDARDLVEQLRELQLVKREQLDEIICDLQPHCTDAVALGQALVEKGWLTAFQEKLLRAHRGSELIVGSYRLLDLLGVGGMGVVFKARHVRMDRVVALKVIGRGRLNRPKSIERFFREARAAALLQHPNIVLAFDADQAGATHYFAMEYVEGIDLRALVNHGGPLPVGEACEYIRQALVGLQHAFERGVVHRDLKPSNLLLSAAPGQPPVVKILDFGLARLANDEEPEPHVTGPNTVVGTVDYLAPEQAQDAGAADVRSDIYSLGCTLFFLLTGQPPFNSGDLLQRITARVTTDAPPIRSVRPDVPAGLAQILAQMLARNPADRSSTPIEVAGALLPFAASR